MTPSAAVLVCALELLGRSADRLPPIELVEAPPPDGSPTANGFVRHGTPIIFLVTSSAAFRDARCGKRASLLHLASVIVHEAWHVEHGSDERRAYEAQLNALLRLGVTPQHFVYRSVYRSMQSVLKTQKEAEERRARAIEDAIARGDLPPLASKTDTPRADIPEERLDGRADGLIPGALAASRCARVNSPTSAGGCP